MFLFANVGNDSENPETLHYLHEYALPFAEKHGLPLYEVHRAGQTLFQHLTRPGNTFAGIPMRLSNGRPGKRACTESYKIEVIDDWLIAYGGVGQMLIRERIQTRDDCVAIIRRAGLPEPPPSRCWFCPFQSIAHWRALRRERPARFEDSFNQGRRSKVWLTRRLIPLRQVVQGPRAEEHPDDFCESGHCWT